jgi:hypothetical protein
LTTQTDTDRYHASFPNLDRPERWPGEENHYRSDLKVGDVVRMPYGYLGRITAWNNTWSHIRGGRLVHVESLLTYDGSDLGRDVKPYSTHGSWESDLAPAQPGDVASHVTGAGSIGWQHVPATWQSWGEGGGPNR